MNSLSKSLLLYILLIFLLQQRRSYFLFFGAIRQNWMLTDICHVAAIYTGIFDMSCICIPYFLWYYFRLVTGEQPLILDSSFVLRSKLFFISCLTEQIKITSAIHTFNSFCYSSKSHIFYSLRQYVRRECLRMSIYVFLIISLLNY